MLPLGLSKQVACVGKGWYPLTVHQHGIPANMIHMQVGAQNRVDGLRRITSISEILQKMRLHMRPVGYGALFVIADAGIHKNTSFARVHHQRMNAHLQIPLVVHKVRLHPSKRQAGFSRRIRQNKTRPAETFDLYNSRNLYITHYPLIHCLTPFVL